MLENWRAKRVAKIEERAAKKVDRSRSLIAVKKEFEKLQDRKNICGERIHSRDVAVAGLQERADHLQSEVTRLEAKRIECGNRVKSRDAEIRRLRALLEANKIDWRPK